MISWILIFLFNYCYKEQPLNSKNKALKARLPLTFINIPTQNLRRDN